MKMSVSAAHRTSEPIQGTAGFGRILEHTGRMRGVKGNCYESDAYTHTTAAIINKAIRLSNTVLRLFFRQPLNTQ